MIEPSNKTKGNLVYEPDLDKRPAFIPETALLADMIRKCHAAADGMAVPWTQWAAIARDLGQECAKRCWAYPGPTDQEDPPEGGTPVAMRVAA